MSEHGDEIEFEGGFFEEAEVDVNEVPDDPYGFGNEFWRVFVVSVGKAKVTQNGDKVGMMVKFAVDSPEYLGTKVAESLGNGNWYRLPVPVGLRGQIPWEPKGLEEKKALFQLGQLYAALGFPKDQWPKVNGALMVGKAFLTKIKVSQDEKGFYQFRLNGMKPLAGDGSDAGMGEFTSQGTSNPNVGLTPEEILKKEMEEA